MAGISDSDTEGDGQPWSLAEASLDRVVHDLPLVREVYAEAGVYMELHPDARYTDMSEMYHDAVSNRWAPDEIDISDDAAMWNSELLDDDRLYLTRLLIFCAATHGFLHHYAGQELYSLVQVPEARAYYALHTLATTLHTEMYASLLQHYLPDDYLQAGHWSVLCQKAATRRKLQWNSRWTCNSAVSPAQRVVALAVFDGIFFTTSTMAVLTLLRRGIYMRGLLISTQLMYRDHIRNTRFTCLLYTRMKQAVDRRTLEKIMRQAVQIEQDFVTYAIPVDLMGIEIMQAHRFIEFAADRLALCLGFQKIYQSDNPFNNTCLLDRLENRWQTGTVPLHTEQGEPYTQTAT